MHYWLIVAFLLGWLGFVVWMTCPPEPPREPRPARVRTVAAAGWGLVGT